MDPRVSFHSDRALALWPEEQRYNPPTHMFSLFGVQASVIVQREKNMPV